MGLRDDIVAQLVAVPDGQRSVLDEYHRGDLGTAARSAKEYLRNVTAMIATIVEERRAAVAATWDPQKKIGSPEGLLAIEVMQGSGSVAIPLALRQTFANIFGREPNATENARVLEPLATVEILLRESLKHLPAPEWQPGLESVDDITVE